MILRWFILLFFGLLGCAEERTEEVSISRVEIHPESLELIRLQRRVLDVSVWDEGGRRVEGAAIRWSSSAPEVVSVDGRGGLLALASGEAEIRAEAGGKVASAQVKVREAKLESLTIEPSSPRVVEGESIALEATIRDELGHAYAGLPIEWESSAPLYVEVDASGVATGLWMNQRATIEARHGELHDSVEVEVMAPVHRILVEPPRVALLEGETARIEATVLDANLELLERPLVWSSENEDIARVDETGEITAVAPGEVRIFASVEERSSFMRVDISPRAAELELLLSPLDLRVGGQVPLKAVARDARGERVPDLEVSWSVGDESVAHLLGDAAVEAIAPGTTTIHAKNERHGVEASVTLRIREAAQMHLYGFSGDVWPAGERFPLQVAFMEGGGQMVAARDPVFFSHDESVATIDQEGRVELVGVGQATVGVRAEGHSASLDRTVAVRFKEMALGQQSTCGLVTNGSVWCWGRKAIAGEEGTNFVASWIPEKVAEGIVAIRHGKGSCEELPPAGEALCDVSYGLREDGSLLVFHLGLPPRPIEAPALVDFDAAAGELCGITAEAEVHCLGQSLDAPGPAEAILMHPLGHCLLVEGALRCQGQGPFQVDLSAWTFARAPGAPFPFSASSGHGCALSSDGEAICWGENEMGQIQGPPDGEGVWLEPRVVASGVEAVAVAEGVSFLKREEGGLELRGMGRILLTPPDFAACLEDGIPRFARQEEIASLHTGEGSHRCLLVEGGRPYCWGTNEYSQSGHPPMVSSDQSYRLVVLGLMSPIPESPFLLVNDFEGKEYANVLHPANRYEPSCAPGAEPAD